MTGSSSTPVVGFKVYDGNCHCGAVKFTIKAVEHPTVTECNCSFCFKTGYKYLTPGPGCLTFIRGEESLKDYVFGAKTLLHRFCPKCGTHVAEKKVSSPPGEGLSINIRTLHDVDIWDLPVKQIDGKAFQPSYDPPLFTGSEPTAVFENSKTYTGGCHCGNVTMALKTAGPLPDDHEHIQQCNCSICMRNGTILTYPRATQVSTVTREAPHIYMFGRRFQEHTFCGTCGVSVWLKRIPGLPGNTEKWDAGLPVNLRCFDGVEWEEIEIKKGYWKDVGAEYTVAD